MMKEQITDRKQEQTDAAHDGMKQGWSGTFEQLAK
jgi:hypothetical protein